MGYPSEHDVKSFSLEELKRKLVSLKTVSTKIIKELGHCFRKDTRLLAKHSHHQLHSAVWSFHDSDLRFLRISWTFHPSRPEPVGNESSVFVTDSLDVKLHCIWVVASQTYILKPGQTDSDELPPLKDENSNPGIISSTPCRCKVGLDFVVYKTSQHSTEFNKDYSKTTKQKHKWLRTVRPA